MLENYVVLMLQLFLGIQAIAPAGKPLPPRRAALYARAALYHGLRKNIDPFELVALARNESDFDDRTIGPDGLDCGLTQTRITYSRYSCEELMRSPFIAFAEAARELSAYEKGCRGRTDYDRCRLNRYNSGLRYARKGFHGRYYLRLACFAAAARGRLPFQERCRTVQSEEQLALWIREASGAPYGDRDATMLARSYAPAQGLPGPDRAPPWQVRVLSIGMSGEDDQGLAIVDRPGRGRLRALRRKLARRRGRTAGAARTSCGAPTRPAAQAQALDLLRWTDLDAARDDLPGRG